MINHQKKGNEKLVNQDQLINLVDLLWIWYLMQYVSSEEYPEGKSELVNSKRSR